MTEPGVLAVSLAAAHGQGWRQVGELLVAFGLSSVIGLERQIRGKSAGLRTQAIVGTAAALIMLVSKYGFADVISYNRVVLDPSRVAAQIVSGIGFLGAGLIITREGAIRGLTTAASVWETAAIGMAAAAGLPLLALVVTGLHFVIVLGYTPLTARLPSGRHSTRLIVTYRDGEGILRRLLTECTRRRWTVTSMSVPGSGGGLGALVHREATAEEALVTVAIALAGPKVEEAVNALGGVEGVTGVETADEERE